MTMPGTSRPTPESEPELERHAEQVQRSAEAHMGKTTKDRRAKKSAVADATAVDAHLELNHHKHNKGLPLPGNQDPDAA
jgi:hypothetical protein